MAIASPGARIIPPFRYRVVVIDRVLPCSPRSTPDEPSESTPWRSHLIPPRPASSSPTTTSRKPDLILLDIMMPRLSGYEVCHRLKSSEATRAIPILMVTALAEMSDIEKGIDAGADDFLTKPINKLELITRVRSLLRVRHLTNDYERLLEHVRNVESQREQPGNR